MAKDINKIAFDKATKLKLSIFRECFKEWLPVFIHNQFVKRNFIYDFFSGSGKDKEGNPGSPIILLEEAMGENQMYCSKSTKNHVVFAFNEKMKRKSQVLQENIDDHIENCLKNCGRDECVYNRHVGNYDFKETLERPNLKQILKDPQYGKFILLDQYGFNQVDNDVFLTLVNSPKTDFIFFISSSFVRRFKEHEYTKKYIETHKMDFDESKPKECHQILADYFRDLIPKSKEYYLHHFTIKKGSNYYGLIFGSGHTFGMEKFLKVCWEKDKMSGESNFNINYDFEPNTLFYTEENTVKIIKFKNELTKKILEGEIKTNLEGMKYALKSGVPTKAFVEVMSDIKDKVNIQGKFNKKCTNIHRLKDEDLYQIQITK